MTVNERIAQLRALMESKGIDAYVVPSTDPHMSEYVAEHWQSRAFISGFTGSAGTVVITKDRSGLWTDSRYFLQAEQQLAYTEIELFKMGMPDVPDYQDFLYNSLLENDVVGFDGRCFSTAEAKKLEKKFSAKGININSNYDLIAPIWSDRPSIPMNEIFIHDVKFAGKSRNEKIDEIRRGMKEQSCNIHIIGSLDDIAWIFNIRGNDVDYNPVAIAYAIIRENTAQLFIYEDKVPLDVRKELEDEGIEVISYEKVALKISDLKDETVLVDTSKLNNWLYSNIPFSCRIVEGMNVSTKLKAQKNNTEVEGIKKALRRDGSAMVEFYHWLENNVGKEKITELSAAKKLREFRSAKENFVGESFSTIAGYKEHGAIVHYSADEKSDAEIKKEGFFLLDSGGQYLDGTTDITRMIHLSEPTAQEKKDYTLVLKGHINLAMAKFPANTRGSQLDVLARGFLWNNGINYLHGTGHGVGCFLNVHEGPQNIRMEENPNTLKPGMINSNEPGVYRSGQYGIRIENLIIVRENEETDFGKFYNFETLTLCPIETKPIDKHYLSEAEINWLNEYHKQVYESLAPLLGEEHKNWLKEKTKAI
ncbi:MAG: aminopeptidase P family protein [Candidatus Kapaibacterium sp.]